MEKYILNKKRECNINGSIKSYDLCSSKSLSKKEIETEFSNFKYLGRGVIHFIEDFTLCNKQEVMHFFINND